MSLQTSEQLKAARAACNLTRGQLAELTEQSERTVSAETVKRLENGKGDLSANVSTINTLQRALESKGIIFIARNGGPAGIRVLEQ